MKILLVCLIMLFHGTVLANPYNYKITRVIDGDTVEFSAKFLPAPLKPVLSLRVYGVDTPEKGFRAKCSSENARALAATEFTQKMISRSSKHQILVKEWDKYGGRVLGDVILDGVSLRTKLIEEGYAREYFGEAKKSWC